MDMYARRNSASESSPRLRGLSPVHLHRKAKTLVHVTSSASSAQNDVVSVNCAFCNRQRARGQLVQKCSHHFYPSMSAARRSSQEDEQSPKKQGLQVSMSMQNLTALQAEAESRVAMKKRLALQLVRLFQAAARGDLESIEWYMLSGVDVWLRDEENRTILHIAAAQGRISIVEFLVRHNPEHINDTDQWNYTPLNCALNNGHVSVAEFLVANGAMRPTSGSRADIGVRICSLAAKGCLDDLQVLESRGADLSLADYDSRTPLHLAAAEGHLEVCKFLVEVGGAHINAIDRFGTTPLQSAVSHGHQIVASYLQEMGATVDDVSRNVLVYKLLAASDSGDLAALQLLIGQEAVNVNERDYDDRTALHLAAANGHKAVVEYLLEHGADINAFDRWSADPHHEAVKNGHSEIADLLDPDHKCSLREPIPLDDRNGDDRVPVDNFTCCLRFGQRRNLVHAALLQLVVHVCQLYNWAYGEVWTADKSRLALQCCTKSSYCKHDTPALDRFRLGSQNILAEAAVFFNGAPVKTGKSVWSPDLKNVSQSVFISAPMARAAGLASCVAIPLRISASDGHNLAYVVLYDDKLRPVAADELENIERIFASVANLLVCCAKLQEEEIPRTEFVETVQKFMGAMDGSASDRRFLVTVLIELRIVDQFLLWGESMAGEDHRIAMPVLRWIAGNIGESPRLLNHLITVFKFLYTVSPLMESESPIRAQAEAALNDLVADGHDLGSLPYFGPGKLKSPVTSHLAVMKEHLEDIWNESSHRTTIEAMVIHVLNRQTLSLSPSEAFDMCGSHNASSPWGGKANGFFRFGAPPNTKAPKADESDEIASFGTELLRSRAPRDLLTPETILEMHRRLSIEDDATSGEFRSGLVVGSHQFYQFYRVFAPAAEVPELISLFMTTLHDCKPPMPPVMHAFYVFSCLVFYIHPFEDGNGRIGRIFSNLILKSYGLPPVLRSNHKIITFEEFISLVAIAS